MPGLTRHVPADPPPRATRGLVPASYTFDSPRPAPARADRRGCDRDRLQSLAQPGGDRQPVTSGGLGPAGRGQPQEEGLRAADPGNLLLPRAVLEERAGSAFNAPARDSTFPLVWSHLGACASKRTDVEVISPDSTDRGQLGLAQIHLHLDGEPGVHAHAERLVRRVWERTRITLSGLRRGSARWIRSLVHTC